MSIFEEVKTMKGTRITGAILATTAAMISIAAMGEGAEARDRGAGEQLAYSGEMNSLERKRFFERLCNTGVSSCDDWEDVLHNDGTRSANYYRAVVGEGERARNIHEFQETIRPRSEDALLAEHLASVVHSAKRGEYTELIETLSSYSRLKIASRSHALGAVLTDYVLDSNYPYSEERRSTMWQAVRLLGRVHTENSVELLREGRRDDFWQQLPAFQSLPEEEQSQSVNLMVNGVVVAIERLPLDMALSLLEEMYEWPRSGKPLRRSLVSAVDTLWQRKKGVHFPRTNPTVMPWGGPGTMPDLYPDWVFGPGGVRVEKPFGEDPNELTPEEEERRKQEVLKKHWEWVEAQKTETVLETEQPFVEP